MINSDSTLVRKAKTNMRGLIVVLIVVWLVYAALSIAGPATRAINQYRINLTQINLLRVTILVPLLLIWLAALFAAARFRHYARQISNSPEGPAFRKIAWGLLMLLLVLIVPSFINLTSNFFPGPNTEPVVTITRTYVSIILYLLAFWYLYRGSQRLLELVPSAQHSDQRQQRYTAAPVVVAVLAVIYAWAIFHNQFRTVSTDPLIRPTYFLPDWLIVTTVYLPYLIIWLWGIWTVINVRAFARDVEGIIYRKVFTYFSYGLTYTVALLIGLQFLAQASTVFGRSSLRVILIVIYALILAIAAGYVFLARGARQLSTIEEV